MGAMSVYVTNAVIASQPQLLKLMKAWAKPLQAAMCSGRGGLPEKQF
jgi:hypothetical protein